MKSKRVLSGLLITGLILSNGVTVLAAPQQVVDKEIQVVLDASEVNAVKDPQISEEKARELAKKYIKEFFSIDIDEEQFQVNVQNREDIGLNSGSNIWYLNLHQNKKDIDLSLDVSINGDNGKLMSINRWEYNRLGQNQVSRFTRDEAEKVAQEFLKSRHSDILNQLELDERYILNYYPQGEGLRPTDYRFNFARQKDGIPVFSDGVNIGVNSGTGEITSYSFTWSNEKLPDKANIISKEKAQEIIQKDLDASLNYIAVRDMNNPYYDQIKELKLAYSPKYENGTLIDANTGEFINFSGASNVDVKKRDLTKEQKLEIDRLADKHNVAEEITTKEEASKKAEEIFKEIYNEDIKILSINYSSNMRMNNSNYKSWEIRFGFNDSSMSEGYMSLDAATGNVINLNYYNWQLRDRLERGEEATNTSKLTWEQAYDKAIDILKKIHPDKLKSTETEQSYRENYHYYNDKQVKDVEYYFNFTRKENEVNFNNNSISISFDTATGMVQNIYMNWDDIELPKVDNIINKEEAKNTFLNQLDVRLAYSYIYPNGIGERKPEIKLVYSNQPKGDFAYYNLLDAKTGEFMDWNGQEKTSTESKQDLIDKLSNHWAHKELKIMAERNIINLEKVKLEDKVTKKQVLKMAVTAKGNVYYGGNELAELKFTDVAKSDEDYRSLQLAVEYGLIDNQAKALDADKYITREELAELLIKVIDFDKVASIQGIYKLPVLDAEDISKERLGHVALAYGLGIINGRGENYLPKEEVDLAQVAVSIYRTMESMGNFFR